MDDDGTDGEEAERCHYLAGWDAIVTERSVSEGWCDE